MLRRVADPEPWSPREGSRWGLLLEPSSVPVKSSFPEQLSRDGTSLLSGLIAHVRCIYRSDCLCRAQQTNRLLFCQAPFVIGGGWEHFNAAIIWRPHLHCRHQPRRAGRCPRDPSPGRAGRGRRAAPRRCSSHPPPSERSLLAPSRAQDPQSKPLRVILVQSDHPPVACKCSCSHLGIWQHLCPARDEPCVCAGELPVSSVCRRCDCDAGSEVLQRLFGEVLSMQLYQRTRRARQLFLAFVNNVKEWLKAARTLKIKNNSLAGFCSLLGFLKEEA